MDGGHGGACCLEGGLGWDVGGVWGCWHGAGACSICVLTLLLIEVVKWW